MPPLNAVDGFRASTGDLSWLDVDQFGNEPVYCGAEKPDNDNDVLYSGSDDDAYDGGAQERKARYQAQAMRYLEGKHMSLVSTSLMGPFRKDYGWVNPWRSKSAAARAAKDDETVAVARKRRRTQQNVRLGKQATVRQDQESDRLVPEAIWNGASSSENSYAALPSPRVEFGSDQHTETSGTSQCALASPGDNQLQIYLPTNKKHPYLDTKVLDRIQHWRHDVQTKAKLEARDRFSVGGEAAEMLSRPKRKGTQDENWLRKQPTKRFKSQCLSSPVPSYESPTAHLREIPARPSPAQARSRAAKATLSRPPSAKAEPLATRQVRAKAPKRSRREDSSQQALPGSIARNPPGLPTPAAKQPEPPRDLPTLRTNQIQQLSQSQSVDMPPPDTTELTPHALRVCLQRGQLGEFLPSDDFRQVATAFGISFTSTGPAPRAFTSPGGASDEPDQARRTKSSPPPVSHPSGVAKSKRSARLEHKRGSQRLAQDGFPYDKRHSQVTDIEPSYHSQADRSFRFKSKAPRRTRVSRKTTSLEHQEVIGTELHEEHNEGPEAEREVSAAVQDLQAAIKTQRPISDHPTESLGAEEDGSKPEDRVVVDAEVSEDTAPEDQELQDTRPEPAQTEDVSHVSRGIATPHTNDVEVPPRLPEFDWLRSAIDFGGIPSPALNLPALASPAHGDRASSAKSTSSVESDIPPSIQDDQDMHAGNAQPVHIINVLSLMNRVQEEEADAESSSLSDETSQANAVGNGAENLARNGPNTSPSGTPLNAAAFPHLPLSSPTVEGPTLLASQPSTESESSASSSSRAHAPLLPGPTEDLQAKPAGSPANSRSPGLCKQSSSQQGDSPDPEIATRTADETIIVDDNLQSSISGKPDDEQALSHADNLASNRVADVVACEIEYTTHQGHEPDTAHKPPPHQPQGQTTHSTVQPRSSPLPPLEQHSPWTKPNQATYASPPTHRIKPGDPPVENTLRQPAAGSQGCSMILASGVKVAKESTQSPWQRGDSQITAPLKTARQLVLLRNPLSSPTDSLSSLPSIDNYVAPTERDQCCHHAMSQPVSDLYSPHLCPQTPVPGQSSSLPSPSLGKSVQSLDDTATLDYQSRSKDGRHEDRTQQAPASSPDPWRLPSTHYLLNRVSANPWSGRSSLKKAGKRSKKRVSWLVPGGEETEKDSAAEEGNDASQGARRESPCSNGKSSDKDIEEQSTPPTPHDHRPASPPPSLTSLNQLPAASQKFGKHFIAMTKGVRGLKRAVGDRWSIPVRRIRMRPALLPSESQQTCNSPAVEAMAEKFIEADGQQQQPDVDEEGSGRTTDAQGEEAAEKENDREDDDEGLGSSDKPVGESTLGRWHSDVQMHSPDPSTTTLPPPLVDVSLADVSAVMDNLDEFLESWNVEAEVARAKTDKATEEGEEHLLERRRREEENDGEDEARANSGTSGMVHNFGGMGAASGHAGGHGHRGSSQLAVLMDIGVWE